MSELISTGVTFGVGRQAINNAFSGEAQFNIMSAVTYYSGSTNLEDIFSIKASDVASPFSGNSLTGSIVPISGSNESIGDHSFVAGGKNNYASGVASHAEGWGTSASTPMAHSEGYNTTASGPQSHAQGNQTTASGSQSHSEGWRTTASNSQSHAEGYNTTASGNQSHAQGNQTTASGDISHAEGSGTTASGNYSHAEGFGTAAHGASSHAEGQDTTISSLANAGHAEGFGTYVSGAFGAHAEGRNTTASGNFGSHAEGYSTIASSNSSHSEGFNTLASGPQSHAEGFSTTASGTDSHAQNNSTLASGSFSHAGGQSSSATTTSAFAHGQSNLASGNISFAIGSFNNATAANSFASGRNSSSEGEYSFVHSNYSTVEAEKSVILGGENNRLTSSATGSTILGGTGITGTSENTVYGVNFDASGSVSANTYYSGGTNLSDLFPSALDLKTSSVSTAEYDLNRVLLSDFKFFAKLTLYSATSTSLTTDIPIIPLNYEGKSYFKLNSLLVSYLNRYDSGSTIYPDPGFISFNNLLNTGATRMEITLNGDKNGQYNYIEDTAVDLTIANDGSITAPEYSQGLNPMPNISTEAVLMNHSGRTGFDGFIDIVLIFEGMLI